MDKEVDEEKTLLIIKPDGVRRGLVGEVIGRLERKDLAITEIEMVTLSDERAGELYSVHRGKKFYEGLIKYMTSGPVIAIKIVGNGSVKIVRKLVGSTNPAEAEPGTIRGDLATTIDENLVHASDSSESAQREIAVMFP